MVRSPFFGKVNRNMVLLLGGQFISSLGDHIWALALPWLVYDLTGSSVVMSGMLAIQYIPQILLSVGIGVYVDRTDRRRTMIAFTLIPAAVIATIVLLVYVDQVSVWILYPAAFVLSVTGLVYGTARDALVPSIASRENLVWANTKLRLVNSVSKVVGPLLAGMLIGLIGTANSLTVDALTFIALLLALLAIEVPNGTSPAPRQRRDFWKEAAEGLTFVRRNQLILQVTIPILIQNVGAAAAISSLVFFARSVLQLTAAATSLIYTIGAVGTVGLTLLAPIVGKRFSTRSLLPIVFLVSGLGILGLAVSRTWLEAGIAFALQTGSAGFLNTLYYSMIQSETPPELLGRVLAVSTTLARIVSPVTMSLAGIAVAYSDSRTVLLGAAGLVLVTALVTAFLTYQPARRVPAEASSSQH